MLRQITNNEFFTNIDFVRKHFKLLNPNQIVLDYNAGQFVWGVVALEYKIANGINRETALSQIYMCELFEDNCIEGIKKLYGEGQIEVLKNKNIPKNMRNKGLIAVFKHNGKLITNCLQADATKYSFKFNKAEIYRNDLTAGQKALFEVQ